MNQEPVRPLSYHQAPGPSARLHLTITTASQHECSSESRSYSLLYGLPYQYEMDGTSNSLRQPSSLHGEAVFCSARPPKHELPSRIQRTWPARPSAVPRSSHYSRGDFSKKKPSSFATSPNSNRGLYDKSPLECVVLANVVNEWRRHFAVEKNMLQLGCIAIALEPIYKSVNMSTGSSTKNVAGSRKGRPPLRDHLVGTELVALTKALVVPLYNTADL
jgi:hypothetical protein